MTTTTSGYCPAIDPADTPEPMATYPTATLDRAVRFVPVFPDSLREAWDVSEAHHPAVAAWLDGYPAALLLMAPERRTAALSLSGHSPDALDRWAEQLGYADIEDMSLRLGWPDELRCQLAHR